MCPRHITLFIVSKDGVTAVSTLRHVESTALCVCVCVWNGSRGTADSESGSKFPSVAWRTPDVFQVFVIPLKFCAVRFDYWGVVSYCFLRSAVYQTAVPHNKEDDAADNQHSHDQQHVQHNHEGGVVRRVCWLVGTHEVLWSYRQQQFVVVLLGGKTPEKANSELISGLLTGRQTQGYVVLRAEYSYSSRTWWQRGRAGLCCFEGGI